MGKPGLGPLLVPDPNMVSTGLKGTGSNDTFDNKNREVNLISYAPHNLPELYIDDYELSAEDRTFRILSTVGEIVTITEWESENLN